MRNAGAIVSRQVARCDGLTTSRQVRLPHDRSPEEAGLFASRGAISSSALASSKGRSSYASKGATSRPLEPSIGEHRPDRVVNCNDSREKPKLAVRFEIVRHLK